MSKRIEVQDEDETDAEALGFGMRLEAARLVRGYRFAADIDRLLGLATGQWSRYEKGDTSPKRPMLRQFADALDISYDALFGRHDDFSRTAMMPARTAILDDPARSGIVENQLMRTSGRAGLHEEPQSGYQSPLPLEKLKA